MTFARISPGTARGRVRPPGSKSYTHRALVVAHLARHRFRIERPLDASDTRATLAAIRSLGSRVGEGSDAWTVAPATAPRHGRPTIDCGESGTTFRFVTALAAIQDREVRLTGRGRLPERPIGPLTSALRVLGATLRTAPGGASLPLTVRGPIHGGRVGVASSESSQFASALLLVAPTLDGPTELRLEGRIVSRPYLDATLAMLRASRIRIGERGTTVRIPGAQRYEGTAFKVPGDASSAAYLWAAAAVSGGEVRVDGIPREWPQADLTVLDLLTAFGARVTRREGGTTVRAGTTRPFTVDLSPSPDLYPLAGVLAAVTAGRSRLRGAPHVVHKESDRRAETISLVRALGGRTHLEGRDLAVDGTDSPRPLDRWISGDHRMVMSAAVGAFAARHPSRIGDARCVAKSFPGFWNVLRSLTDGRDDR